MFHVPESLKGGRGQCPHCKEMHNNVSYHEALECPKRPHTCLYEGEGKERKCIVCGIQKDLPFGVQSIPAEGLKFNCDLCHELIVQPAALLFSPPYKDGTVRKFHICQGCFTDTCDMLNLDYEQ